MIMFDKSNVFIVDDHKIIRDCLKHYINNFPEFNVVGESKNGQDTLDSLQHLEIDIILLDMFMPDMNGVQLIRKVHQGKPEIKILMISMMDKKYYIDKALKVGAHGYILKDTDEEELHTALLKLSAGKNYLSERVLEILKEGEKSYSNLENADNGPQVNLTEREYEILDMIINEYSNAEIADKLGISIRTVNAHKRNLQEKTETNNIAGLVVFAYEHGLLSKSA